MQFLQIFIYVAQVCVSTSSVEERQFDRLNSRQDDRIISYLYLLSLIRLDSFKKQGFMYMIFHTHRDVLYWLHTYRRIELVINGNRTSLTKSPIPSMSRETLIVAASWI